MREGPDLPAEMFPATTNGTNEERKRKKEQRQTKERGINNSYCSRQVSSQVKQLSGFCGFSPEVGSIAREGEANYASDLGS